MLVIPHRSEIDDVARDMMTVIKTSEELEQAFSKSQQHPIVLFKHSATCPFSARAQEQAAEAKHDVDIYCTVVQYDKAMSDAIAEHTGVEHASPQAIVIDKGDAVWHGWRGEIQKDILKKLAGGAPAS